MGLGRQLRSALEQLELCASDPLWAERVPNNEDAVLHGAACHACLFAPETSCERGNKYLDRTVLVPPARLAVQQVDKTRVSRVPAGPASRAESRQLD
jgi:hypothetical protein